jgi:hypothetical protein
VHAYQQPCRNGSVQHVMRDDGERLLARDHTGVGRHLGHESGAHPLTLAAM